MADSESDLVYSSFSTFEQHPPPSSVHCRYPNLTRVPVLLHLSFNQDNSCFSVGTDVGFRTYTCDPFGETILHHFDSSGGIGLVQMLFRSNIIALVGGGFCPRYSPKKVMIWDNLTRGCIGELSTRSEVKGVRLRRDRIVVISVQTIRIYDFLDANLLLQIETIANPNGLCEVSYNSGQMVLVCPGMQKGQVWVELFESKETKIIMAHESRLACLALTTDGRFLATASIKGTLVRVFNILDGSLVQEVRRGADRANIYSIAFSSTAQWLAVSSDRGTVHVFGLNIDSSSSRIDSDLAKSNVSSLSIVSSLSFIKGVLPRYFSSQWSVARFCLREGLQHLVAFGQKENTIIIIGMDGSFYRCQFDPVNGGEMTQLEYYNFLQPDDSFERRDDTA